MPNVGFLRPPAARAGLNGMLAQGVRIESTRSYWPYCHRDCDCIDLELTYVPPTLEGFQPCVDTLVYKLVLYVGCPVVEFSYTLTDPVPATTDELIDDIVLSLNNNPQFYAIATAENNGSDQLRIKGKGKSVRLDFSWRLVGRDRDWLMLEEVASVSNDIFTTIPYGIVVTHNPSLPYIQQRMIHPPQGGVISDDEVFIGVSTRCLHNNESEDSDCYPFSPKADEDRGNKCSSAYTCGQCVKVLEEGNMFVSLLQPATSLKDYLIFYNGTDTPALRGCISTTDVAPPGPVTDFDYFPEGSKIIDLYEGGAIAKIKVVRSTTFT